MLKYAAFTGLGDREQNEDAIAIAQRGDAYCFILCDGLGGHGRGEVASNYVSQSIKSQFEQAESTEAFWKACLDIAQEGLLSEQKRLNAPSEMKTTAVVLTIEGEVAQWAHIGDSRLYAFRRGKVYMRTLDHSVPQMLVLAGDIREKSIRSHPDRNRLLRVMGIPWGARNYERSEPMRLRKGDSFLLCSDGFWEPVLEKEMLKALKKSTSAQEWIDAMQGIAVKNGESGDMDNYSVIAVQIC